MSDPLEIARSSVAVYEALIEFGEEHPVYTDWMGIDGAAARREAVVEFAKTTEEYLSKLTDTQREELFDRLAWDWEWLPSVMAELQRRNIKWYQAGVLRIMVATVLILEDENNG